MKDGWMDGTLDYKGIYDILIDNDSAPDHSVVVKLLSDFGEKQFDDLRSRR